MKVHIRTLGCRMNQLDAARLRASLVAAGHEPVDHPAEAEAVIVNTCTVTAEAERKSRQQARAAARAGKRVLVCGCGPRVDGAGWRRVAPGAEVHLDPASLLAGLDAAPTEALPLPGRTRMTVAIQHGCDDVCSFCITRIARGRHRSVPEGEVLRQIRAAEAAGYREVVLTGINLAAWGAQDTRRPQEARLGRLLARILEATAIPRLRLSSLGPQYLDAAFFEAFADPRVCDHLHLSVQSGSDRVLRRMRRGHDAETVLRVAERARAVRPDVSLAADLIAGFPGETEAEFDETLALVRTAGLSHLHVFPFSARAGTEAAALPGQIPAEERRRRAAALRALGRAQRAAFVQARLGRRYPVLVEDDGTGLTPNFIRLRAPGAAEGEIAEVEVSPGTLA
ncbi:MiaB/RimO family radical SAM methylthiotransferase [Inmirania thermothiophila]|uniref:Threonylcarbamoyladenosine tRNA methylthiotransferase MtaB n=1 Tax=Inmirania thermothiophila TaxID=1750597 RepID=A0A3N1XT03_9GAMM|nr:MiaB/RimO family radical SAM methylthiotransferase [Inmirania thermothiophila]ROR29786.1 threonylcarbamoyladenosine tRNA methylthiotransferase MtaB [Inmirania thermothiophila]